jgi:uncharacterized membrane protein YoaK (UPF0700 family)
VKPDSDDGQIRNHNVVLALLSFAAGFTDVLTFLGLGDLFTSAMTGNVALLAIAIGRWQLTAASRSAAALVGFALGVVLAAAAAKSLGAPGDHRRVLRRLMLIELAFLLACTAVWSGNAGSVQGGAFYVIVVLSAVSMGVQAVAARSINEAGISTIVFTSGLISILTSATHAVAASPHAGGASRLPGVTKPQLATFAAYAIGGAIAAFLVSRHIPGAIWVPPTAVAVALGVSERTGKGPR